MNDLLYFYPFCVLFCQTLKMDAFFISISGFNVASIHKRIITYITMPLYNRAVSDVTAKIRSNDSEMKRPETQPSSPRCHLPQEKLLTGETFETSALRATEISLTECFAKKKIKNNTGKMN